MPKTYPSQAAWSQIFQSVCGPPSAKYLGYAIYPNGRFFPSAIFPDPAAWATGVRSIWCGISARTNLYTPSGQTAPFAGAVRGQSQELPIPVGTCLGAGTTTTIGAPVPCSQPHVAEVTGTATVSGVDQFPSTSSAMQSAVGDQCAALATQYEGGTLASGVGVGWLTMSEASWDAGKRIVPCSVGEFDAIGNPIPRTGSLRG